MALTAKMLKGLGLTDEQREAILEEHANTVNEIKAERDRLKADAEKLSDVQKELDEIKGGEDYKAKYDTLLAQVEGEKNQRRSPAMPDPSVSIESMNA